MGLGTMDLGCESRLGSESRKARNGVRISEGAEGAEHAVKRFRVCCMFLSEAWGVRM